MAADLDLEHEIADTFHDFGKGKTDKRCSLGKIDHLSNFHATHFRRLRKSPSVQISPSEIGAYNGGDYEDRAVAYLSHRAALYDQEIENTHMNIPRRPILNLAPHYSSDNVVGVIFDMGSSISGIYQDPVRWKGSVPKPIFLNLKTIAGSWDRAGKSEYNQVLLNIRTEVETVVPIFPYRAGDHYRNATYFRFVFSKDKNQLHIGDHLKIDHSLLNLKAISCDVRNLCNAITGMGYNNERGTVADKFESFAANPRVIQSITGNLLSGDLSKYNLTFKSGNGEKSLRTTLAESLLYAIYDANDISFFYDLKRSQDYGQVEIAKWLNENTDASTRGFDIIKVFSGRDPHPTVPKGFSDLCAGMNSSLLATGDRLCYVKAKMQGVPSLLTVRTAKTCNLFTKGLQVNHVEQLEAIAKSLVLPKVSSERCKLYVSHLTKLQESLQKIPIMTAIEIQQPTIVAVRFNDENNSKYRTLYDGCHANLRQSIASIVKLIDRIKDCLIITQMEKIKENLKRRRSGSYEEGDVYQSPGTQNIHQVLYDSICSKWGSHSEQKRFDSQLYAVMKTGTVTDEFIQLTDNHKTVFLEYIRSSLKHFRRIQDVMTLFSEDANMAVAALKERMGLEEQLIETMDMMHGYIESFLSELNDINGPSHTINIESVSEVDISKSFERVDEMVEDDEEEVEPLASTHSQGTSIPLGISRSSLLLLLAYYNTNKTARGRLVSPKIHLKNPNLFAKSETGKYTLVGEDDSTIPMLPKFNEVHYLMNTFLAQLPKLATDCEANIGMWRNYLHTRESTSQEPPEEGTLFNLIGTSLVHPTIYRLIASYFSLKNKTRFNLYDKFSHMKSQYDTLSLHWRNADKFIAGLENLHEPEDLSFGPLQVENKNLRSQQFPDFVVDPVTNAIARTLGIDLMVIDKCLAKMFEGRPQEVTLFQDPVNQNMALTYCPYKSVDELYRGMLSSFTKNIRGLDFQQHAEYLGHSYDHIKSKVSNFVHEAMTILKGVAHFCYFSLTVPVSKESVEWRSVDSLLRNYAHQNGGSPPHGLEDKMWLTNSDVNTDTDVEANTTIPVRHPIPMPGAMRNIYLRESRLLSAHYKFDEGVDGVCFTSIYDDVGLIRPKANRIATLLDNDIVSLQELVTACNHVVEELPDDTDIKGMRFTCYDNPLLMRCMGFSDIEQIEAQLLMKLGKANTNFMRHCPAVGIPHQALPMVTAHGGSSFFSDSLRSNLFNKTLKRLRKKMDKRLI